MKYLVLFLITMVFSEFQNSANMKSPSSGDITVFVEDIQEIKGELLVGIYASRKTFRKVDKVFKYELAPVQSKLEVLTLKAIPAGTYAIVIFQDLNSNRKFDSGLLGMPKEPFGFSTNFEVKRRAPNFRDVKFEHRGSKTELTVKMQKW